MIIIDPSIEMKDGTLLKDGNILAEPIRSTDKDFNRLGKMKAVWMPTLNSTYIIHNGNNIPSDYLLI